jgi:DNA-directed RNA polymerase subunit F
MTELLKQEDELDNQANNLAAKYQKTASGDKDKIQKQIEETVNKQFEVRQKRRKLQLDRMQKDLDELRTIYENKNASKDALIKGRVQQLLNGGGLGF